MTEKNTQLIDKKKSQLNSCKKNYEFKIKSHNYYLKGMILKNHDE